MAQMLRAVREKNARQTSYPTNRLVGSRPAGDIKTPRKKPETPGAPQRVGFEQFRKSFFRRYMLGKSVGSDDLSQILFFVD
ncbi:hypothetical protein D3C75_442810 [compost metagenome]